MILQDEARLLRLRESALFDEFKDNRPDFVAGSLSLLARTKVLHSYPTLASCYFACEPLAVLGTETEGGPGVVSGNSTTFFALNLGSTIPPSGTQIVVTNVGNRWVFRYDS
jgi:hypothetical protein